MSPLPRVSIALKVPLALALLVSLAFAAMTVVVDREMRATVLLMTSARLDNAARQLADLMGNGVRTRGAALAALAALPGSLEFLHTHDPGARAALETVFTQYVAGAAETNVEVWDPDGKRLLAVGAVLPDLPDDAVREAVAALAGAKAPWTSPFRSPRGVLRYSIGVPVREGALVRGYLVERRQLSTPAQSVSLMSGLIGDGATLLLGNVSGTSWSDLRTTVAPPSMDLAGRTDLIAYQRAGHEPVFARAVAVPGSSWLVAAEIPQTLVLAPVTRMLSRVLALAVLVIGSATAFGWWLSRRLTVPLRLVTRAAEAIADARPSPQLALDRTDELGRLAMSFNTMSDRVEASRRGHEASIRELERASIVVRASEERLAGIIDSAMDAIISVDSGLRVVLFNHAAEQMFGWQAADVIGQPLERFVPPRFRGAHHPDIEQFARAGVTVRANGEEFPIEASISQIVNGGETVFTVILRDVSGRQRAEDALRTSEARYHGMIDSMLEAAQVIGFDWRYLYLNDAAARAAHQPKDEMLGRTVMERFPGFEDTEMFRVLRRCMEERTAAHQDFDFTFPDGTCASFEFGIQPVPEGLFILSLDITARKQTEDAIRALNADLERRVRERTAQLEDANRELESFSYSVSHDLRAPLRHIHGYGQMLQRATAAGDFPDQARRCLDTILAASTEMGALIDDLLAFSRTGRVEMATSMVPLSELVSEVIRGLEMSTKDRHIEWRVAPLPAAAGDRALIRQVLANLIGNAVKYTRMRDPAVIEIACAGHENGRLVVFVRDNGAGFDQQYVHKLFGVFQRLHRTEEFEGTGIGLATVSRIVGRHGGRVWAEGEVETGATFSFTLAPWLPPASFDPHPNGEMPTP